MYQTDVIQKKIKEVFRDDLRTIFCLQPIPKTEAGKKTAFDCGCYCQFIVGIYHPKKTCWSTSTMPPNDMLLCVYSWATMISSFGIYWQGSWLNRWLLVTLSMGRILRTWRSKSTTMQRPSGEKTTEVGTPRRQAPTNTLGTYPRPSLVYGLDILTKRLVVGYLGYVDPGSGVEFSQKDSEHFPFKSREWIHHFTFLFRVMYREPPQQDKNLAKPCLSTWCTEKKQVS